MGAITTIPAQTFRLRTQLLSRGRSHDILASSKGMPVAIKCYATGGENEFHTHLNEDRRQQARGPGGYSRGVLRIAGDRYCLGDGL